MFLDFEEKSFNEIKCILDWSDNLLSLKFMCFVQSFIFIILWWCDFW